MARVSIHITISDRERNKNFGPMFLEAIEDILSSQYDSESEQLLVLESTDLEPGCLDVICEKVSGRLKASEEEVERHILAFVRGLLMEKGVEIRAPEYLN